MQTILLDADSLEAAVRHRRDMQHSFSNPSDRRWIKRAFQHRCVLMSTTRLKAEVFLLQN